MTDLGMNVKLTIAEENRTKVRSVFVDILQATASQPKPGLDIYELADGAHVGVFFAAREATLDDAANEKAPWLELRVDDPSAIAGKLAAGGLRRVANPDVAHSYFQLPGGPVFRLAPTGGAAGATPYLLTIRGAVAPKTVEEARRTHNMTAGDPQGVAAAQSLGDLSHAVYVPLGKAAGAASELFFVDQWNDLGGLGKFFANADVQKGGGMMFASRDAVVWAPADDLPRAHMPRSAAGRERYIGIVRGLVRSRASAKEIVGELFGRQLLAARRHGLLSREYFYRVAGPGEAPSVELLGFDVWSDAKGMTDSYATGVDLDALQKLFQGAPTTAVWERPGGEWVEW